MDTYTPTLQKIVVILVFVHHVNPVYLCPVYVFIHQVGVISWQHLQSKKNTKTKQQR